MRSENVQRIEDAWRESDAEKDAEIARLTRALEAIANMHKGDQPAAYGGNELIWANMHIANMRQVALSAISVKRHTVSGSDAADDDDL